jgi:hypothetical protein
MDNTIRYLNTDLVLVSPDDLTPLVANFKAHGVYDLFVTHEQDGLWYATFETNESHEQPEPNIAAMVAVVEVLDEAQRSVWSRCTLREFNMGYDCGAEPWAFNHGLSNDLLNRIARAGASLRLTLYPNRDDAGEPSAGSDGD